MGRRAVAILVCALLLALALFFAWPAAQEDVREPSSAVPDAAPLAPAAPPSTAVQGPSEPSLEERLATQVRAARLVEAIRAEVEPTYWAAHLPTRDALLEVREEVLLARASNDVLDGVEAWLDARRKATSAEAVGGAAVDPGTRLRALDALRTVLRRMRLQEVRVDAAVAADNRAVDDLLALVETLDALPPDVPPEVEQSTAWRRWETVRRGRALMDWILLWPSQATGFEALAHWKEAGRPLLGLRGPERAEVLERGSVSVHLEHTALPDVLRALQVESLVDVVADPRLPAPLVVSRLEAEGRPLQEILDRLREVLGDGCVWRTSSRTIELTRPSLPPEFRLRYFDIGDLIRADAGR